MLCDIQSTTVLCDTGLVRTFAELEFVLVSGRYYEIEIRAEFDRSFCVSVQRIAAAITVCTRVVVLENRAKMHQNRSQSV